MTVEQIAQVCHEANRGYCSAIGDDSQPIWQDALDWQKKSAIDGVKVQLNGAFSPEEQHAAWMRAKVFEGWKYGPVKDPINKEHPCLVPYYDLPVEQRLKDALFIAVVNALKG